MTVNHRASDAADTSMVEARTEGIGFVDLVNDRSKFTSTDVDPASASGDPVVTEEIVIGEETWVRGSAVAELVGQLDPDVGAEPLNAGADRWFRVPPKGGGVTFVSSLRVRPESLLNQLGGKASVLRPAGTDLVRGVATRHYVVKASGVTTTNEAYRAQSFEVWIDEQDLLRRIAQSVSFATDSSDTPTMQTLEMTAEFFDFGAHEEVLAPPPDQVTAMPLGSGSECIAATDSGVIENVEGLQLCSSDDPEIPQPPLELPPPTVDATAAGLEFRPVVSEPAGPCPAPETVPVPDRPVTLPSAESGCLALAPAALIVTRAEATAQLDPDGDLEVAFTLNQEDTAAFDQLANAHLGERVALVLLGRVLSAPRIETSGFHGRGIISGLDRQAAADVVAALSG